MAKREAAAAGPAARAPGVGAARARAEGVLVRARACGLSVRAGAAAAAAAVVRRRRFGAVAAPPADDAALEEYESDDPPEAGDSERMRVARGFSDPRRPPDRPPLEAGDSERTRVARGFGLGVEARALGPVVVPRDGEQALHLRARNARTTVYARGPSREVMSPKRKGSDTSMM